jgi:hypothetical protein
VAVSSVFLLAAAAHAQGVFLQRGEDGLGAQGSLFLTENTSGFGAAFGVSVKGILDVALSVERVEFQEMMGGRDLAAYSGGPSLTIYLARTSLISVTASVAYERVSFSGQIPTDNIKSIHSNVVALGTSLYHFKEKPGRLNLIPFLSAVVTSTETVWKFESARPYARSKSDIDETLLVATGLTFGVRHKDQNTFFLTPTIFINDKGNVGVGVTLGYVGVTKRQ